MKTSLGEPISSLHCTATSSLGKDYYLDWVCHAAHSALVMWSLVAPLPEAGDLDHRDACLFSVASLWFHGGVTFSFVRVSLMKNDSFVVWPFPVL